MLVNKIDYRNFGKCYEIIINDKKMVVSTEFGPRILHFGKENGENILFTDDNRVFTNKKGWYLYGGHRLWLSPESSSTYNPDNNKCRIEQNDNQISFIGLDFRLKLELKISIINKNDRIYINHIIHNTGDVICMGGIWALTCIKPEGTVFFPWGTQGNFRMHKIIYWQNWMGNTTDINSKQFIPTKDLFLIKPTGETGKVGTTGHEAFIGVTKDNCTFIKKFKRELSNDYPDDNCAIECYTCNLFIELETLGPCTSHMPGVPVSHTEEWILLDRKVDPNNGDEIRKIVSS